MPADNPGSISYPPISAQGRAVYSAVIGSDSQGRLKIAVQLDAAAEVYAAFELTGDEARATGEALARLASLRTASGQPSILDD